MTTQENLRTLARNLRQCADLADLAIQTADNLDRLLPIIPVADTIAATKPATAPEPTAPAASKPAKSPRKLPAKSAKVAVEAPVATQPKAPRRQNPVTRATSFVQAVATVLDKAPDEFTAPDLVPLLRATGFVDHADKCLQNPSRMPCTLMSFLDTGRIVRTGQKRGQAPIYRHGERKAVTLTPAQQLHQQIRREVDAKIPHPVD